MVEVGRYAAGQPAVIEEVDPETPTEEDVESSPASDGSVRAQVRELTHGFQLRPDLPVSFKLPEDLTPVEATRLAGLHQDVAVLITTWAAAYVSLTVRDDRDDHVCGRSRIISTDGRG